MKKLVSIKFDVELDAVVLRVMIDAHTKIDTRWTCRNSDKKKLARVIKDAKVRCYDLLWEYTELGYDAKIIPYLN